VQTPGIWSEQVNLFGDAIAGIGGKRLSDKRLSKGQLSVRPDSICLLIALISP